MHLRGLRDRLALLLAAALGGADGGTGDLMDQHGCPRPLHPDGRRALVSGEYGGLGLAMPGRAWSVRQPYVDVDPAAYTDDCLTKLAEVHALACKGSNGASSVCARPGRP